MKVKNKRIIVTGAAAGIGKELTIQLLAKGASVMALDINAENLNILKETVNNENLSIYVVNIADDKSIIDFKNECSIKNIKIDGIINNAGIIQPFVNIDKIDIETINRVMNINFYGPLKLTKLFLPDFLTLEEAHIVNISSMGGFFPFPGQTIYGASKAALKLLTEGLYSELLETNVKVTVVFPGAIETDIAKNSNVEIKIKEGNDNYKMTSAKKAAEIIIKGIEKNKFKLYVGSDSKIMNIMYKLNDKAAIKMINKKMRDM